MTIKKAPRPIDAALAKFVSSAPDARAGLGNPPAAQPVTSQKNRKNPKPSADQITQITLKLSQGDLDQVDAAASAQRLSRAGFIRQAVFSAIRQLG